MKLLILTTATNRPLLHKRTFQTYKEFLDKALDITWIVNIDYVEKFGFSAEETEKNIREIFRDRDVKFIFNKNEDGWFNRAVRTLLTLGERFIDDMDCVLWLEDDWKYKNSRGVRFLDTFAFDLDGKEHKILSMKFINLLSKRPQVKEVTLQPTVWSTSAFKDFCEIYKVERDKKTCPELILERSYNLKGLMRFRYPLFSDAGREWLQSNNIKKLPKTKFGGRNSNYKEIR